MAPRHASGEGDNPKSKTSKPLLDEHKYFTQVLNERRSSFPRLEPLDRLRVINSYKRVVPAGRWENFVQSLEPPERLERPFQFLNLPPEIRDKILEYALQDNRQYLTHLQLPLLTRVSRQLRLEALPIFFSTTEFLIPVHTDYYDFFEDDRMKVANPGTIRLSLRVRGLLREAGDAVVVRQVEFHAYRMLDFERTMEDLAQHFHDGGTTEECLWRRNEALVGHELQYSRASGLRDGMINTNPFLSRGLASTCAVGEWAHSIASREGFKGFTLDDLRSIANEFRVPVWQ